MSEKFRPEYSGSDDTTLKLWEIASGKEVRTLSGHAARVSSVAFSPNGKLALSGDSTLWLWEVASGNVLAQFVSFINGGEWAVVTPSGYYDSSENGDLLINVRIDNKVYGADKYRKHFKRPDLVKAALAGNPKK